MARDADGLDPQKRQPRKPPTFRHLPEQRAKKLKQQWVLKQKIKSQWKAQKRKEGIVTHRDVRIAATKRDDMEAVSGSSISARHARDAVDSGNGDSSAEDDGASNDETSDESEPQQAQQPHAPPARSQASRKTRSDEPPQPASSYRDLQRQAYSRESLHHFKSGRGGKSARGGGGARDRGRGRGGGGQPDMRLRMNAMLEKIKHTVSEK